MHCGSITLNVLLCFGCYRFFKQVSEKSECGGTPQNGCIWKICSLHKWASGGFGACVPWVPQAQLYQTPAAHQGLPYPCQHWTQADQSLVPEQTVWCLLHKAFLPSFLPSVFHCPPPMSQLLSHLPLLPSPFISTRAFCRTFCFPCNCSEWSPVPMNQHGDSITRRHSHSHLL